MANLASTINAAATVVLVFVTAIYAYLTWGIVTETRRARKQEAKPILNLDTEPVFVGSSSPKLENIGNGPAINLSANVKLEPAGEEFSIQSKNIAPGGFTGSMEPQISQDTLQNYDYLTVEGTYKNIFDEEVSFRDSYDLKALSESNTVDDLMKEGRQKRQLDKIERHLESIADSIEMDGFENVLAMEFRGRILTIIENNEPISLRELINQTGMSRMELGNDLSWLHNSGIIEFDEKPENLLGEENLDTQIRLASMDS